jgi:hypothetical protein
MVSPWGSRFPLEPFVLAALGGRADRAERRGVGRRSSLWLFLRPSPLKLRRSNPQLDRLPRALGAGERDALMEALVIRERVAHQEIGSTLGVSRHAQRESE